MPLKYGQSFMDKEITRRVTINAGGKSTPLDLVFKPYQSLLIRVDINGDPRFVDITYVPRTPVVKEDPLPAASPFRAQDLPAPSTANVRTVETALGTLRLGENFRILLPRPGYERQLWDMN